MTINRETKPSQQLLSLQSCLINADSPILMLVLSKNEILLPVFQISEHSPFLLEVHVSYTVVVGK